MATNPARRDLIARRNIPFGRTWSFVNDDDTPFDLTNYTGAMQVRLYEGAAGSALIDLANVTSDIEGVRVYPSDGQVQVIISEATVAALPGQNTPEAGDPQVFRYDLVLIDATAIQSVWLYGTFTVDPGVTD
jgi:hypothetical protein